MPLLALFLLIALALGVFSATVYASAATDHDLSRPGSSHNVTVDSVGMIEFYLGKAIPDGEREYLMKHGDVSIKYDTGITSSYVLTEYDNGTLTVRAYEYTYTAADGTSVAWIPSSVSLADAPTYFTAGDDEYVAVLFDVPSEDELAVYVDYTLDVSVPRDTLNRLLNFAFNNAPAIKAEIEAAYAEQDRLNAEYEAGMIAYDEYLKAMLVYEAEYAAYTDYLSRKKIYADAKAEYDEYLIELEKYEEKMLVYREYERQMEIYNAAYAEYVAYLAAIDLYNKTLPEYEAYLENMAIVRAQLAVMDTINTPMTDNRTLYSAIMGSTVTGVLENESILSGNLMGVDANVIAEAGDATYALREMLPEYFALTTDAERYQYYISHYSALRDNFVKLLRTLDELYNYKKVRGALKTQDTTYPRKYEILVAQLTLISTGLTDERIMSYYGEYEMCGSMLIEEYKVDEILGYTVYFEDADNAAPLSGGYPGVMNEPVYPEKEVERPVMPQAPAVPAKPNEVADPGNPPSEILEPVLPTPVYQPAKPEQYTPDPEKLALVNDYDAGLIVARDEADTDMIYTATATVTKKIFNVTTVTVAFHDDTGRLLERTTVDSGTRADYTGDIPTRDEDASAVYTFSGWVDSLGKDVDLSRVDTDMSLYPKFDAAVKYYSVTFDVDGALTVYTLPYGSIPQPDLAPVRAADTSYEYTFGGWDRELAAVTGSCTYRAVFNAIPILPIVSESGDVTGAAITTDSSYYYADCTNTSIYSFDLTKLIRYATAGGTAKGIVITARNAAVTIGYNTLLSMRANGDTVVSVSALKSGDYSYSYTVSVTDGAEASAHASYRVTLHVPTLEAAGAGERLYTVGDGDVKTAVAYSKDGERLRFNAETGVIYVLAEEYTVNVVQPSNGKISVSVTEACPLDGVSVKVDLPLGIALDRLYLVHPDGTEEEVSAEGFTMPSHAVTLSAVTSYIEYTVTFTDGNTVLVSYKMLYGENVTPPAAPTRPTDDRYRYVFLRWSPVITSVTGDATYDAVYDRIPVEKQNDDGGFKVSDSVRRLIIAAAVAASMLVFVVIPSTVITVCLARRERKMYAPVRVSKDE